MKHLINMLISMLMVAMVFAQGTSLPLNGDSYHIIDRFDVKYGKVLPISHTSSKPYSRKWLADYALKVSGANLTGNKQFNYNLAYQLIENSEWLEDTVIKSKKPFLKIFYKEPAHLLTVDSKGFILKVDPVIHFQLGAEFGSQELKFVNTRGIEMRGYIKKRLGFYTYLTDNQQHRNQHVDQMLH